MLKRRRRARKRPPKVSAASIVVDGKSVRFVDVKPGPFTNSLATPAARLDDCPLGFVAEHAVVEYEFARANDAGAFFVDLRSGQIDGAHYKTAKVKFIRARKRRR